MGFNSGFKGLRSLCGSNNETFIKLVHRYLVCSDEWKGKYADLFIQNISKSFGYDKENSKVNDFAAMFEGKFHGPCFFEESTVTGIV